MRSLTAARLVLLDSDAARRESLREALSASIPGIVGIAAVSEASRFTSDPPDLYVIEHASLAANDEGVLITNPFSSTGAATILLLAGATNAQRREAIRAGYTVVIGTPVSTRLLYRRIAHTLQVLRRSRRRPHPKSGGTASLPAVEASPLPAVELLQG